MNLHEYAQYDALGLAELVRSKAVTARELCALALQGIDQVNPQLNAVLEKLETVVAANRTLEEFHLQRKAQGASPR